MRPYSYTLPICASLAMALAGCNGVQDQAQATPEQQSASAASSATGIATDAAVSQLYAGSPVPVAWQPPVSTTMHDGPTIDHLALLRGGNSDAPVAPSVGTGTVLAKTDYLNPSWTSGSIAWSADTAGLNPGWYHISITFSAADPFTVHDENGNSVTISGGGFEIYVHDTLVSDSGTGNWERIVDHYPAIPGSSPLAVTVTRADGTVHSYDLTGQRHARRDIVRTKTASGTTATVNRTDAVSIDGDYSALSGSGAAFTPATDPTLNDRAGTPRIFTNWQCAGTGAWASHSLIWNRYCTYQIAWQSQYTVGGTPSFTWNGTVSNWNENVYVTLDSVQAGPFNDAQLRARFSTLLNLNRSSGGM